jgi:WD40 repeat protein
MHLNKYFVARKRVLTSSDDSTAKLWDINSGKIIQNLIGHKGKIHSALFSPDEKHILTASSDSTVKLWNIENEGKYITLNGHSDIINSAQFSSDGKFIVTSSDDNIAMVWEKETGKLLLSLEGMAEYINAADFSPDGKKFVIASNDNMAKIWDSETGELLKTLCGHASWVKNATYSPDGKYIFTVSIDKCLKSWSSETGLLLFSLNNVNSQGKSIQFSNDGKNFITFFNDTILQIREVITGRILNQLLGHRIKVNSVKYSNNDSFISTTSFNTVKVWDASSGKLLNNIVFDSIEVFTSIFGVDTERLLIVTDDGSQLLNWRSGKLIYELESHIKWFNTVDFSPDGNKIATPSWDGSVKIWDAKTGIIKDTLLGDTWSIRLCRFNPDGKKLMTSSYDGITKIWDLVSGTYRSLIGEYYCINWEKGICITSDHAKLMFYNIHTGILKLTLVPLGTSEWAIFNNDGLFDATSGAMQRMYFNLCNQVIELEQLKSRYYEPGLWSKILGINKEPIKKVEDINMIKLFPEIITYPVLGNILKFKLIDRGGGLGKVQILINGKEYSGPIKIDNRKGHSAICSINMSNHPYLLNGNENIITIKAYDHNNWLKSRGAEVIFFPKAKVSTEETRLFAIVVGISNYKGDQLDLSYASNDASDFSSALTLGASKLFGTSKFEVLLLNTDSDADFYSTKSNILGAFDSIAKKAKSTDILVVYLAGHGTNFGGQDGDFYFLTSDALSNNLNDEFIRKSTSISSIELTENIKNIACLKQVIILDVCHSGKFADNLVVKREDISSSVYRAYERMKDRTGIYILAGCAADAVSYETSVYGQGLLTYSLLLGMKGAALRENTFIDVMSLFQYASDEVPILAKNIGGIQRPQIRCPYEAQSFDIGMFTDREKTLLTIKEPKPLFLRTSFQPLNSYRDTLNLSIIIDNSLQNYNHKGDFVFIDASYYPDAYSINGRYIHKADKIIAYVEVYKGDKLVFKYISEGLNSESIAREILHTCINLINKNN